MKRKFTLLIAALALLTMMASTGRMWGQTTYTLTIQTSDFNTTSYAANNGNHTKNAVDVSNSNNTMEITWNSNQVYQNSNAMQWQKNKGYIYNVTDLGTINSVTVNSTEGSFTTYYGTSSHPTSGTTVGNGFFTTAVGNATGKTTSLVINFTIAASNTPSISANDVNIAYDATNGSIAYTIENEVTGGSLTAATTSDWLTLPETFASPIQFTCTTNGTILARTATVTLTYTYNAKATVTKNVIVTQAGNPNASGSANNPYTVAQAIAAIDAQGTIEEAYATGIVCQVDSYNSNYSSITYWISDDGTTTTKLQVYSGKGINGADFSSINDVQVGATVVIKGKLKKYNSTYEFDLNNQLVSYVAPVNPIITVTPATVNAPVEGTSGTLTVTYENITDIAADVWFCDAAGENDATYDWVTAEINTDDNVYYLVEENNGEARTAYFKVWAYDDDMNEVYSDLVTISQDEYVAPTYATLPFEFDGGRADIEETDGLSQEGLGSDYGSSPKLKFDNTGDWLLLQFSERPGVLTFKVKGNPGGNPSVWAGTFTVQTSTDGETFTDFVSYDDLSSTATTKTIDNLGENVRYIKWTYNKTSGNVALGDINLAKYVAPQASITINPGPYNLNSEGGDAVLPVTYTNMPTDPQAEVIFYESDGETPLTENPTWITANINNDGNVAGHIDANTGDARSAYFKVKGIDANSNPVYSALVTINQAAYALNIVFETTELNIEVGGEQDRVLSFEYQGFGQNPTFEVRQYDATGQTQTTYEWLTTTITQVHKVNITVAANTGAARSGYFKVYGSDGTVNTESNLVTINQAEYVAPTYTVTYNANGGTGTMTDPNSPYTANTEVTLLDNTFTAPEGKIWDSWLVKDANQTTIAVNNNTFTMPASNVTVTAQWVDNPVVPTYEWVLTALEDLTSSDIFVIVGNNGNNYAMANDKGASAPTATAVTIANNKLSDAPANNLKWNISGNATDGYTFYPNGSTTTWLYCIDNNNGLKVGNSSNNTFVIKDNYLYNQGQERYIGIYNSSDWRSYTTINNNIASQTFGFYKRQEATTDPQLYTNDVNIESDATAGEITYTLENEVTGGVLSAEITDGNEGNWLNLGTVGATVPFTCSANTEATARTATVTLTYSYGENSITATAVVTQAALVIDFATLPFAFDGGRDDIANVNGLTQEGLDSDYGSTPKLKFNSTGDWVILKLNEAPKSLSYDIKGNSFQDGSIFTVQTSADGNEYTDLASYTTLGEVQSITHVDLDADVRYIKWIYTNKKTGNVALGNIHATEHYDTYGDVTLNDLNLTASSESLIVHSGSVVTLTGTVTNDSPDNLVIEDGGQLIHTGDVAATLLKDYKATTWPNTKSVSGWYTIASPVDGANVSVVTTTANYDFYAYDEANYTWRNEKVPANGITTFEQGVGYLYATSADKQGSFAGTMKATNAEVEKDLSYECTLANMKGFNLMGNPFTRNLTSGDVKLGDSYLTNYFVVEGGSELVAREIATYPIKPGQGFMVQATAENQKLVFNPSTAKGRSTNNGHISIAVGNESFNDMAYINIANGNTLRKMTLNTDSPKVYVMNNNKDYAAARVENLSASMPVCFQTKNIGTYTITVKANELDVEYLHLIDNVLHEDIDLLLEPSYNFIASGHDNAARFTLVFKANANIDEIEANDIFAYQNGSDIIVNGNGELQVFDATGRMVMNTQVNGIQTVNIPATGMYIFRMVGDEVKTQKIVVR